MSTHNGEKKVEFIPARLLPPDDPFFKPSEPHKEIRRRTKRVNNLVRIMRKEGGDLPLKKLEEESIAARGRLSEILKAALRRLLEENYPEKEHPGISAAMEGWLENATPEALAEWLEDVDCRKRAEHEHKPELVEAELKPELEKHFPLPGDIYDWATRRASRFCLALFAIPLARAAKTPEGKPAKWLYMLAAPWLRERADKEAERLAKEAALKVAEEKARPMAPQIVRTKSGSIYAQAPKMLAGIAWAFGGHGIKLPDGYKTAPNMAAIVPTSWELVHKSFHKKPRAFTVTLPLIFDDDPPHFMLCVANADSDVLSTEAARLCLYIASAVWDKPDFLISTNIEDLTIATNPPNIELQPYHYLNTEKGLCMIRSCHVLWPSGYADAMFYVPRWPWKELDEKARKVPLKIGFDPHFIQQTIPDMAEATGVSGIIGQFPWNVTGTMSLPPKQPGMLRQYLRTACMGNAIYARRGGKPAPEQVPWIPLERWAALTNYIPRTASEYMAGRIDKRDEKRYLVGRVAKSKVLKRMVEDAKYLEERGMMRPELDSPKHPKAIRPMLSKSDIEAWEAFRAGKASTEGV